MSKHKEYCLVDGIDRIIWISSSFDECVEAQGVLLANPEDVSEKEEIKWEALLRSVEFVEPLTIKKCNNDK